MSVIEVREAVSKVMNTASRGIHGAQSFTIYVFPFSHLSFSLACYEFLAMNRIGFAISPFQYRVFRDRLRHVESGNLSIAT